MIVDISIWMSNFGIIPMCWSNFYKYGDIHSYGAVISMIFITFVCWYDLKIYEFLILKENE